MDFKLSGAQGSIVSTALPFSLNFGLCARLRGRFEPGDLQRALAGLSRRHPLTSVRIAQERDSSSYIFTTENVPPIPLRVIERTDEAAWVGILEQEIARPTDYHIGPMLRCVWLRGDEESDLLLICDHITSDGLSAIYALRDLLTLLAEPDSLSEPLIPRLLGESIPPDMKSLIRDRLASAAPAGSDHPHPDPTPFATPCVLPFELSESETAGLVAACKDRDLTVQAALCAAFAIPFAERQPERPRRAIECPVDLRKRLVQPIGEVYCNYISLTYIDLDCPPGIDAWQVATQAGKALSNVSPESLFTIPLVMMTQAEQPLSIPVVGYQYDLSISNIGRVAIPEAYGALQLESIYGPIFPASTPGHRILGVNTFAGRMRFTYTSCDPEVPRLLQRAREILTAMLQKG
jgi:hypothetical protein